MLSSKEYREGATAVKKEITWTIWRFIGVFFLILAIGGVVGFATKSLGLWGSTVVERAVFTHSYQRSESLKSRIATEEATIAEIESQLSNPELDQSTRFNLQAQLRAAQVRRDSARRMQ